MREQGIADGGGLSFFPLRRQRASLILLSNPSMLSIAADPWSAVVRHCEAAYPDEACGILLGAAATVTAAFPCRNAYPGPQHDRFQFDPAEQIAAIQFARDNRLEIIGFFHSHPDRDAYFSREDLRHAWPNRSYLVLAIRDGRFEAAAAFRLDGESAASESLFHPVL